MSNRSPNQRRRQARSSPARGGSRGSPAKSRQQEPYFAAYEDYRRVLNDVEAGRVFSGPVRINPYHRSEMFVTVPGLPFDLLVNDQHQNRALPGDVVAVRVLPEKEWSTRRELAEPAGASSGETETTATPAPHSDEAVDMWPPRVDLDGWAEGRRSLDLEGVTQDEYREHHRAADADALMPGRGSAFADHAAGEGGAGAGGDGAAPAASAHALAAAAALEERAREAGVRPTAAVVRILESVHSRSATGYFQVPNGLQAGQSVPERMRFLFFCPMETTLPWFKVLRRDVPEEVLRDPVKARAELYNASIVKWQESSRNPLARVSAHLGRSGDVEVETALLLREHGVDHGEFSDALLATLDPLREGVVPVRGDGTPCEAGEAARLAEAAGGVDNIPTAWTIPDDERARRRDFTGERVFTIDPTTARDLDDALHIKRLGPTTWEVGVHIADVTYFVRPDTALDAEAQRRATTVYLVQKSVPMLPRLLSNNLCSLNPNVERLAYSCVWRMTVDGDIVRHHEPWYGRSVIRSCCKLDYATAQRIIDGDIARDDADQEAVAPELWDPERLPTGGHRMLSVYDDVLTMHRLAAARRARRFATGALTVHLPKLTFRRSPETGMPYEVGQYVTREANHLVEEYMLAANNLVAERLLRTAGPLSFLRKHDPPNAQFLEKAVTLLRERGITVNASSAGTLNESLGRLRQTCERARSDPGLRASLAKQWRVAESGVEFVFGAVTSIMAGPLVRADYFAVGDSGPDAWRHYGLNMPYYTHFTSPIRRYADVMVHRLLTASLESQARGDAHLDDYYLSVTDLQAVAERCNEKKEAAKKAQTRSDHVFLCLYLHDHPMETVAVVEDTNGDKFCKVIVSNLGFNAQVFYDRSGFQAEYDPEDRSATLNWLRDGPTRTLDGTIIVDHGISDSDAGSDGGDDASAGAGAGAGATASASATRDAFTDAEGRHKQTFKIRPMDAVRVRVTATNRVPMQVIVVLQGPA